MCATRDFPVPPKKSTLGPYRIVCALGLILAWGSQNVHSQSAPAGQQRSSAESLTQALLTLNVRIQSASSVEKPQLLNELNQLAQARQQALAALLQTDPAAALQIALPANLRSGMPAGVQSLVEQEVTLEGALEVSIEDQAKDSRLHHFLNVAGEHLPLHFAAEPPTHLLTGSIVRVHGVRFSRRCPAGRWETLSIFSA